MDRIILALEKSDSLYVFKKRVPQVRLKPTEVLGISIHTFYHTLLVLHLYWCVLYYIIIAKAC